MMLCLFVQCLSDSIEGNGFTVSKGDQEASHKQAKALLYKVRLNSVLQSALSLY